MFVAHQILWKLPVHFLTKMLLMLKIIPRHRKPRLIFPYLLCFSPLGHFTHVIYQLFICSYCLLNINFFVCLLFFCEAFFNDGWVNVFFLTCLYDINSFLSSFMLHALLEFLLLDLRVVSMQYIGITSSFATTIEFLMAMYGYLLSFSMNTMIEVVLILSIIKL